jgi:hypothetical protein
MFARFRLLEKEPSSRKHSGKGPETHRLGEVALALSRNAGSASKAALGYKMQSADQNQQRDEIHMHSASSRRSFLKRMAGISAAGLFLPGLLAACRNEKTATASSGATAAGVAGESCAESEAIPLTAVATRRAVAYVDLSPHAERSCDNCRFFKQPAAGASCGGCEIVGGPIAPAGYCTAWVAQ